MEEKNVKNNDLQNSTQKELKIETPPQKKKPGDITRWSGR
jgi:hypothetical protein